MESPLHMTSNIDLVIFIAGGGTPGEATTCQQDGRYSQVDSVEIRSATVFRGMILSRNHEVILKHGLYGQRKVL